MAELSSPLQVQGLIKTNCSHDSGIYSIYRFIGDYYGEYIGFAFFYSPDNDLDGNDFKDVRLLWETGTITEHGEAFLAEEWALDWDNYVYRNNKGETIKFGSGPFDENGEKLENPNNNEENESSTEDLHALKVRMDMEEYEKLTTYGPEEEIDDVTLRYQIIGCVETLIQTQDVLEKVALNPSIHPLAAEAAVKKLDNPVMIKKAYKVHKNTRKAAKARMKELKRKK